MEGGCTAIQPEVVPDLGSTMGVTPFTVDELCTSPGSAVMTVSGGTAPYTYNWSSGPTTSFLTGISAGTYNFTATDAIGVCVDANSGY